MIDAQSAANGLISSLVKGNAETEFPNGAELFSDIWPQIFNIKPDCKNLAIKISKDLNNETEIKKLRVSLEDVLKKNPDLLQQMQPTITTGNISAANGSVAAAVISGSTVHIENK